MKEQLKYLMLIMLTFIPEILNIILNLLTVFFNILFDLNKMLLQYNADKSKYTIDV